MANLTLVSPNSPIKLTTVEDGKVKGGNTLITVAYPTSYNVTSFVLETEDDGGLLTYPTGALREAGPYNYGSYKAWDFRGYWEDNYISNERTASITFIPQPTSLGLGPATLEIYQDGYQGPTTLLTVDTASISSPGTANTYNVNLSVTDATSNTTYTSSSTAPSWLTCQTNGSWNNGTRAHTITVAQNNTGAARSGSITFTAYNGDFPVSVEKVSVTQSTLVQGDIIWDRTTPGSASVAYDVTESYVRFTASNLYAGGYTASTVNYNNILSAVPISIPSPSGQDQRYTYRIVYNSNPSANTVYRSVDFQMSSSTDIVTKTFWITQSANPDPEPEYSASIDLAPSSADIDGEQNGISVRVTYAGNMAEQTILAPLDIYDVGITFTSTSVAGYDSAVTQAFDYVVDVPQNPTVVTRYPNVKFGMRSSSWDEVGEIFHIAQEGYTTPTYNASVSVTPSTVATSSNQNVITTRVVYAGNMAQQTILAPTCSLPGVTYSSSSAGLDTSVSKSFDYQITVPENTAYTQREFFVSFSMQSSSNAVTKNSLKVTQAGANQPVVAGISVGPSNPNRVSATTNNVTFFVTYSNQVAAGYQVLSTVNSQVNSVQSSSVVDGDSSYYTYNVSFAANGSTTTAVTRSVTFRMISGSNTITETGYIYQDKATETPAHEISCSWTSVTTGSGSFTTTCDVKYTGGTSAASFVNAPIVNGNITSIASQSLGTGTNYVSFRYTITVAANATPNQITSTINWSTFGTGNTSKTSTIIQAGTGVTPTPVQDASIEVVPSQGYVRAASWVSQSTFYATYSGVDPWVVQPVTPSAGMTVTSSSRNGDDSHTKIYTYTLNYSANSSTYPVTRSVILTMRSGSSVTNKYFYVYQDAGSSGTTKYLSVSPGSVTIDASTVQTSCTVYYYGISSAESVSTPTTSDSGWSANVGNVSEQEGLVIVDWEFRGTANSYSNQKTISFSIGASGMTSQAFTIYQRGIGGGGSTTNNVVPVWQQNIISAGDVSSLLTVTSGSKTLFSDWVYARPDVGSATVDFNRICESFVVSDDIGSDTGGTGLVSMTGNSYSIPSFTAAFSSGPSFTSRVLKDWSYSLPYKYGVLSDISQVKAAGGQYIVFTYLNDGSSTTSVSFSRPNGSRTVSVAGLTYQDVVESATCGNYSVGGKVWNVTSNAKWVCYFRNKYNGLESLVLEGAVVPSVEVTRNTYLKGVYNYTKAYLNKVVDKWKCNTGIVADNQTNLVSILIESPEVILHDISGGKLYRTRPVTNSIERKTFRNQGRQFATYEFELESILTQARR